MGPYREKITRISDLGIYTRCFFFFFLLGRGLGVEVVNFFWERFTLFFFFFNQVSRYQSPFVHNDMVSGLQSLLSLYRLFFLLLFLFRILPASRPVLFIIYSYVNAYDIYFFYTGLFLDTMLCFSSLDFLS